jgi:DNA-binding GntR family transcriptional regulator
MASLDFEPPKYARVVVELRKRIEDGTYPPGAMLPSETQLVREFAVGRTTVVRALQMLQHDGWIDREHGRGSFVKGRPSPESGGSRPGLAVLEQPETATSVRLVHVGSAEAPRHIAVVLGLGGSSPVLMRRWTGERDGVPAELVTFWFPEALAYGTDLGASSPLPVGVRAHLHTLKGMRIDHIVERLSARLPVGEEADLLKIKTSAPVLSVLAEVRDAADAALFAVELVMPGALHELEDIYSVTG